MSRQIGEVPTRTYKPGDVIFREGDDAKGEAFMVHLGRVEIRKQIGGEERLLNTLAKGELLGHIALFRNAPRSATAIAAEPVTLMVIPANRLDTNTAQTPGMNRAAAINFARVGAQKIWAGTVHIHANAKTGAHHHGELESVIYVIKGKARMRWGNRLEYVAEAGPGDFIFVPPYVPHQEINASTDQALECVLVRSDGEAIAINLDIEPVEKPETVLWVDPIHHEPAKK